MVDQETNLKKGYVSTFQNPGRTAFPNLVRQRMTAFTTGSSEDLVSLPYARAMTTEAEYLHRSSSKMPV
jgi:hypothetical protein